MALLLRILALFPLPALHALGWGIYVVAFRVVRWRVPLARGNIDAAFPEKPDAERRRILRDCYRNLGTTLVEAIWGYGASGEALRRRVRIVNPDVVDRCRAQNRPAILLAGHLCNWEWLLLAAGAHLRIPIDVVYKPLRLADVDAYVRDARRRFGANPIPHKSFLYEVMRHGDEARAYALLADQTPLARAPKHWIRFLNRDTAFFLGPERIARFLDATVLYVAMKRVGRGYYDVHLEVIAEPPYGDDAGPEIAESYARLLEASIRESPADWLWIHNKWKYPKPRDDSRHARRARRQPGG
ncbi:Kdo2-lipid IVA lauroyltransferase [Burkholderiales bacterium]|nr:Kdo2-lipid IVA lauroyltransferase [Burkholderiales bacterium]